VRGCPDWATGAADAERQVTVGRERTTGFDVKSAQTGIRRFAATAVKTPEDGHTVTVRHGRPVSIAVVCRLRPPVVERREPFAVGLDGLRIDPGGSEPRFLTESGDGGSPGIGHRGPAE
jgi:hypothetical protein